MEKQFAPASLPRSSMDSTRIMEGRHDPSQILPQAAGIGLRIQDKLIAWGRGRAMDAPDNGYPSQTTFARFIRNPGQANVSLPPLPEDDFNRIDVEVSRMRLKKPDHHKALCLYYVERMSDAKMGRFLRISRHHAKNLRENAEHYLEAKLDD